MTACAGGQAQLACGHKALAKSEKPSALTPLSPAPAQVEVRLRPTATQPSFLMAFTDPLLDVDVSGQMAAHGAVEMGLTQARTAAPLV